MKWEYKREIAQLANLKNLGLEGWELCIGEGAYYIFKRPLIEKSIVAKQSEAKIKLSNSKIRKGDWIICDRWKPDIFSKLGSSYRVFSVHGDNIKIINNNHEYYYTYSIKNDNIRKIKFKTPGYCFNK